MLAIMGAHQALTNSLHGGYDGNVHANSVTCARKVVHGIDSSK